MSFFSPSYRHRLGNAEWYTVPGPVSTLLLTDQQQLFVPYYFAEQVTLDRVGVEVTTGGTAASSVIRVGIYKDAGLNYARPGELQVDLGTLDGNPVAFTSITPSSSLVIKQGLVWFSVCQQANPATKSTIRTVTSPTVPFINLSHGTTAAAATQAVAYAKASTSGAFADVTSATTLTTVSAGPRVQFRIV